MNNELLRHTVATIKFRFNLSIAQHSETFGDFSLGKGSRSPIQIINHMRQVMDWTRSMVTEEPRQKDQNTFTDLNEEIERFLKTLDLLDEALAKSIINIQFSKKLIQGPLSDVLTHIGQIAMLSRLNGHPVKGVDYSSEKIQIPE